MDAAHQGPLSMGFSRQEYWSGLPCLPAGDLPDSGFKPVSLASPALAGRFFTTETLGKPPKGYILPMLKALGGLDAKKPFDCVYIEVPKSVSPL